MKVEQEYDFFAIFLSDHLFLSLSGIKPVIPVAKSAFIPLPRFVIKTMFGEMGERLTLDSQRVLPDRLVEEGYKFVHENLEDGLRDSLGMWR